MAKKFHPHALRIMLGLPLKDFANMIHCGLSNLAMIETGKRKLTLQSSLLADLLNLSLIEAQNSKIEKNDHASILQPFLTQQIKLIKIRIEKLEFLLSETQSKADALLLFLKTAEVYKKKFLPPDLQDSAAHAEILQRNGFKKHKQYLIKISKLKIAIAGLYAEVKNAEKQKEA